MPDESVTSIEVPDQTWVDVPGMAVSVIQVSGEAKTIFIHEFEGVRTLAIPSTTRTSWGVRANA